MRIGTVAVSLLASTALVLMGNGLLSTMAAVKLADSGVSESASGWILSGYFAGLALGTLILAPTIERVGGIRAFTAFSAIGVAAALSHGMIDPGWSWVVLRLLSGLAMAGIYLTVESWLNVEATPLSRGRVMAAYLIALYVGTGAGQILLRAWPEAGLEGFVFAALAVSVATANAAVSRVEAPVLQSTERISAYTLLRIAPLGWIGAWLSGIMAGTIYATIPLVGRTQGLPASEISTLMAAYVLGGMAGQWPFGRLSDFTDRRVVLLGVTVALSACCIATPWVNSEWPEARNALAFLYGALAFSLYPLAVAHTLDRAGSAQALPAASQMLLSSSLGAVIGPIVASAASTTIGPDAFYQINAALLASFALAISSRIASIMPVAQEPYVTLPRTTLAIHELDPRIIPSEPAGIATNPLQNRIPNE